MYADSCAPTSLIAQMSTMTAYNNSAVRGRVGMMPLPGSTHVLDRPSRQLVPCTPQLCPLASKIVDTKVGCVLQWHGARSKLQCSFRHGKSLGATYYGIYRGRGWKSANTIALGSHAVKYAIVGVVSMLRGYPRCWYALATGWLVCTAINHICIRNAAMPTRQTGPT